jgi:hypothetical protein
MRAVLPASANAPVFLTLTVVCIVWAVWAFRSERRFLSRAVRATGVVAGIAEEHSAKGGTTYYPVISFATGAGVPMTIQSKNSKRGCRIGDSIPVRYDPDHPENMQIDALLSRWSIVVIATAFAAIFLVIGASSLGSR